MPLSYLFPGTVHNFIPMMLLWSTGSSTNLQPSNNFIFGHSVPVEDKKLKADILESLIIGDVKKEWFIKHWV